MSKCIIVVRNHSGVNSPPDEHLKALDSIFVSPVIEFDFSNNLYEQLDAFDEKFGHFYSNFRFPNYYITKLS